MGLGIRITGLGALVAGAALVALAVPRLNAGLIKIPADPVKRMMGRGVTPTPKDLKRFILNRHDAAMWSEVSRTWMDVGMASLADAGRTSKPTEEQRGRLAGAIHAFDRALALSPANAIAWVRLGEARLRHAGPSAAAAGALEMSVRLAPYQRESLIHRLRMLVMNWRHLSAAGREAVAGQVAMALRDRRLSLQLDKLVRQRKVRKVLGRLITRIKKASG